jgi:hypothetical protein
MSLYKVGYMIYMALLIAYGCYITGKAPYTLTITRGGAFVGVVCNIAVLCYIWLWL